jgi:PBSX family phage terminase large subunit
MTNLQAMARQILKIEKAIQKPAAIAKTSSGKVSIPPKELLNYFIAAIRLGSIPTDHKLYSIFQEAEEDKDQGQIFGCLRKLAQGLTPSIDDGDLFLPTGKQAKSILESNDRLNLWYGSIRSSKTIMSLIKWLDRCCNGPPGRRMMVGNTSETLELNCIEPLKDLLPAAIKHVTGWRHCIIFGRKVVLRGANDVGQEKKFRGPTLIDAYGDEVTTWAKSVFKMLLTRLSRPGAWFGGTTNPDQPLHWLNVDYIERVHELRLKLWHFVLDDNPGLPDEYKADLIRENPPGTVYYLRFILGLWVAAEGRIYNFLTKNASDGYVVDDAPKDLCHWVVSVDYGQQHPTCMGLWGFSPSMKCWYLVKEHYTNNKTNAVYATEFEREMLHYDGKQIIPDSIDVDSGGGGTSLIAELRDKFPQLDATGSICHAIKVDVLNEIQDFAGMIFKGSVRFLSSCGRFIDEMMSYLWDEKARQHGVEKPIKLNDDGPDMGRYFANRAQSMGL